MSVAPMHCRHCGRPIAVPTARCPWPGCRQVIMVICDACKQYTDDQGTFCQQCRQPLVPAQSVSLEPTSQAPTIVPDLAADQERAQLVASSVIADHPTGFFFQGAGQSSILVQLFGAPLTVERQASAMLFAALAYLEQRGYAQLQRGIGRMPGLRWTEARPWDGQEYSLEAKLALLSRARDVLAADDWQQVIAEAMEFRCEVTLLDSDGDRRSRSSVDWAGMQAALATREVSIQRGGTWLGMNASSYSYSLRDVSPYPAAAGVIGLARQTIMPEYQESAACRAVYQLLLDFVQADPGRADHVAEEIRRAFAWFERFRAGAYSRRGPW